MNEKQREEALLKKLEKADTLFHAANPHPRKLEVNQHGNVVLDTRNASDRRWYEG